MKKIIAIFLVVCMVLPFMLVFGAETETEAVAEPIVVSENVKLLSSLGIFDEKFFSKPKDQLVTRGEFAYMVSTIDAPDLGYMTSDYPDVADDNPYVSQIEHAAKNDFIEDYVDGKFRPDEKITYEKVLRAMVHLTGNATYATVTNYDLAVRQLGIARGISANKKAGITFEQAAQILVNTITSPVLDLYIVDSNGDMTMTDEKHENLLERNFDIYSTEGIIESTYISSINSAVQNADPGCFIVNGAQYRSGAIDVGLLLGYNIDFYYHYDKQSNVRELLYMMPLDEDNDITKIAANDVIKPSGRILSYYVKNSKHTFRITNRNDIILNGKLVQDYNVNIFDMDGGSVSIVNNGKKTFVSVVNVKEFYVSSAGTTNGNTVLTVAGGNVDFMGINDDYVCNILKDENVIRLRDVSKGDVFELVTDALKPDGTFDFNGAMYIGGSVIVGQAEALINSVSSDKIKATVEEKSVEYELSKGAKDLVLAGKLGKMKPNSIYMVRLNSLGEIAYYDGAGTVSEKFGIIIKYGKEEKGLNVSVKIKLLASDGEVKTYILPSKLKIDGRSNRNAEDFITQFEYLKSDIIRASDGLTLNRIEPELRMVRYNITEEGVITSIDTCYKNQAGPGMDIKSDAYKAIETDDNEMTCTYEITLEESTERLEGNVLGKSCIIKSGSPYFVLPKAVTKEGKATDADIDDEKKYHAGYTAFKQQDTNYSVFFKGVYSYMRTDYGEVNALAIYSATDGGAIKKIDVNSPMSAGFVKGLIDVYKDEVVEKALVMVNYGNGAESTVLIKDGDTSVLQCQKNKWLDAGETEPNMVQPGDLVRYKTDEEGCLVGLEIAMDFEIVKNKLPAVNTLANGSAVPFQPGKEYTMLQISKGLAYSLGPNSFLKCDTATVGEDGKPIWDLSPNSMMVMKNTIGVSILELDRNGEVRVTPAEFGNIRTYENYGENADMVISFCGEKVIGNLLVVRISE